MKLSPQWLRDFVDFSVDSRRLAEDLTTAGIAVEGISGEGDGTLFEVEITPNRPDAMNHYGVARECSAIYDLPLKVILPLLPRPSHTENVAFDIAIDAWDNCPRFSARVIRNVTIKPSPSHIADRLALLGHRPINNAVDATNYVLWEMGKPTHVFDLDLLEGGKIIVRRARNGETLKTLDGIERKLTADDLVVADAVKPVGLAGIMGGFDTMITDRTRNILIESAWWDPAIVRQMARRHGLHTDASHRFERGADYQSTVLSCDRVAELILQSGGGVLTGSVIDVVARKLDHAPITLRLAEVERILGGKMGVDQVMRILTRLGFEILPESNDAAEDQLELIVHVPSWRLDVEREIDLIEEIARVYGYDKFPNTLPAFAGAVVDPPDFAKDEKLRSSLLGLGYNESVALTFISHRDAEQFASLPVFELANPLSEEAAVMRTSLVPGLLEMVAYNLNRGSNDLRLFEAGNVYEAGNAESSQRKRICLAATGSALPASLHLPARPLNFFDIKGDIETLLSAFESGSLSFQADAPDYYHPGRSVRATLQSETVACLGQVHPEIASARKLRQDVFIGELFLETLYKHPLRLVRFQPLAKYPAVERDFSFVFDETTGFAKILQTVMELRLAELRSFKGVEIFRGGSVPAGKYSFLLRAVFQSSERTLREDDIAQRSAQIVGSLESLGGSQRS